MPKLDLLEEFTDGISLKNLRDTMCHSFISVEESTPTNIGRLIIDDRVLMNRNKHDAQEHKTKGVFLDIEKSQKKLKELHVEVINSIQ